MSPSMRMLVTSISDFFLGFLGTLSGAMIHQGEFIVPGKGVILAGLVVGGIQFWSHIKASLATPPKGG